MKAEGFWAYRGKWESRISRCLPRAERQRTISSLEDGILGARNSLRYRRRNKTPQQSMPARLCGLAICTRMAFYAKSPDFEELSLLGIRIPRKSVGSDLICPVI